jgi:hypothetical protein
MGYDAATIISYGHNHARFPPRRMLEETVLVDFSGLHFVDSWTVLRHGVDGYHSRYVM